MERLVWEISGLFLMAVTLSFLEWTAEGGDLEAFLLCFCVELVVKYGVVRHRHLSSGHAHTTRNRTV